MLKMKDFRSILGIGLKLFLITAISALVLAVMNTVTEPVIARNIAKKQEEAMQKVLPNAESFTPASSLATVDYSIPVSAYIGTDETGERVGYAIMVSPKGYGGEISLAVGVDNDMVVTGLDIISQSETPGLGAKCSKEDFKNQFIGKKSGIEVAKTGAKDNQIDAITSATITSKAVTEGVNLAIDVAEYVKEAE